MNASNSLKIVVLALASASLFACNSGNKAANSNAPATAGHQAYTAELQPLNEQYSNGYSAKGTVSVVTDGDALTVQVNAEGLQPDVAHLQFIQGVGHCPNADADANGDGVVDSAEGKAAYGAPFLALDGALNSAAGNEGFPVADGESKIEYKAMGKVSVVKKNVGSFPSLEGRHVVIYGVHPNTDLPGSVSTLSAGVDAQASVPVACGELHKSQ